MTDFFISYTKVDRPWAEWVAWVLEEEGYTAVVEAWDIRPGSHFMVAMDQAVKSAKRVIAILSPEYGESVYGKAEWAAVMASDPNGVQGKLVPLRVSDWTPTGLLRSVSWIDLVGLDEGKAREQLLRGLSNRRMKPDMPPLFPGGEPQRTTPRHPEYPPVQNVPPHDGAPKHAFRPKAPALPVAADAAMPPRGEPKTAKLERWREYPREQIPPFFGLEFTKALWHAGFVPFAERGVVFLLVTLEKRTMQESHQYEDQFLSPTSFQWQSQNRTAQESKHGQLLRNHVAEGVQVHLFVRAEKKLRTGNGAPFIYCGPVRFKSWRGEQPITVLWTLDEPVPKDLREALKVPAGT